jgi:hypothetical protein
MHTRPASRHARHASSRHEARRTAIASQTSLLPAFATSGLVLVAAIAVAAVTGCAARGNGEQGAEDRTLDAFHGVDVGGVFTLDAAEGSPSSVRVEGDANLVALVETRVDGGILHVTTRERISPSLPLVVRVRTPELREVDVSGAADATLTTSQPRFELEVSGASDVTVRGTTQSFELDVSGASDVDASALKADAVEIDASGASDIDVTATVSLDVDASGASEITWGGGATDVKTDVSGAAEVVRRDAPRDLPLEKP